MKKHLLLISFFAFAMFASAQDIGKMNLALYQIMQHESLPPASVLVQGDLDQLKIFLAANDGVFQCSAGDIASIKIPRDKIAALASQKFIQRIEASVNHFETLNDTMRVKSHINEVHQGLAPLLQPYDGSGVIMGLVDAGIDLSHPDFQDSLGHTRVKWLWDMTKPDSANTPLPYGYGQEWSNAEIDAGTCTHNGQDQFGHGSYVAGIATGNGRAVGHFQGAAPGCDIIAVAFDFAAQDTVSRMAHAVNYIFAKANQLGKPCVINISIGDYLGSHDGLDLQSQFIKNLINQQCGRIVVAGCGDIGTNYSYHLGNDPAAGDTTFTWFTYNTSYHACYAQIFSNVPNFTGVYFAVGADKVTPYYDFRGRTAFHHSSAWGGGVHTETLMNGANRIGVIQSVITIASPGVYSLEYFIVPDSTDYNWRFITTGNGHFDSWSFDWVWQNLPTSVACPDIVHYQTTDTNSTIVSGLQCLDNVICVGQYFNTDRHVDVNNTLQITTTDTSNAIAPNSGRGPTRDGRLKPDICAPGNHIISCGVLAFLPGMIANQPYKVAQGGYHITGGGTSASSPVVAGIGALFLQQNPNACWQDFKTALLTCATVDNYTWGPLPNNSWGYGKANAFSALTTCAPVSVSEINSDHVFEIFPNPASSSVFIKVSGDLVTGNCMLICYDAFGKKIFENKITTAVSEINLSGYSPGIYNFRIESEKNVVMQSMIKL
jgi:subtilisin family serine protease